MMERLFTAYRAMATAHSVYTALYSVHASTHLKIVTYNEMNEDVQG